MTKEELQKAPKWAGIYYFKNLVNNKYYIGQAIMLRKRLVKHFYNWEANQDYPIYKAFTKYGIENFEFGILEEFKSGLTKEELKSKLDELEIKYIKEYNSYGATGYNQTLGGDGGVLGYKMTDSQKEVIKNNSIEVASDGRYLTYIYDVQEHFHYTFINLRYASEILKVNYDTLRNSNNLLRCSRYIIYDSKEDLQSKLESIKNYNKGQFRRKLTQKQFLDISNLKITIKEKCKKLGICEKTYYNYLHLNKEEWLQD